MSLDYVARKPCGCCVAWMSEWVQAKHPRDAAKTVGEWIRSGLSVERMDTETARATVGKCEHKKEPEPLPLFPTTESPE